MKGPNVPSLPAQSPAAVVRTIKDISNNQRRPHKKAAILSEYIGQAMCHSPYDRNPNPIWEEALTAAHQGNNIKVIALLESLWDSGALQVAARIGELYEAGGGDLEKNAPKAEEWYQKAIEKTDDSLAHLGLGRIYYDGATGIIQDRQKSAHHFLKAYSDHLPQAGLYLGIMAYFGVALAKDTEKAKEYFQCAGKDGFVLAFAYLARIEFRSGNMLKSLKLAFASWKLMIRLLTADPHNPKLLGIRK